MPYIDIKERQKYMKDYYQKHIKLILKQHRTYYQNNKNKLLDYQKIYQEKYKNQISIYMKIYKDKNEKYLKEYMNIYYKNHQKELNEYKRKRMKTDINFRLRIYLKNRIWFALRGIGEKSDKTINLIGCSIKQLKQYLRKQFKSGMSWDNYGKWHIDHIKLCASFDLSKLSEQRKCFHYTNLQPLWAKENLEKHDKI